MGKYDQPCTSFSNDDSSSPKETDNAPQKNHLISSKRYSNDDDTLEDDGHICNPASCLCTKIPKYSDSFYNKNLNSFGKTIVSHGKNEEAQKNVSVSFPTNCKNSYQTCWLSTIRKSTKVEQSHYAVSYCNFESLILDIKPQPGHSRNSHDENTSANINPSICSASSNDFKNSMLSAFKQFSFSNVDDIPTYTFKKPIGLLRNFSTECYLSYTTKDQNNITECISPITSHATDKEDASIDMFEIDKRCRAQYKSVPTLKFVVWNFINRSLSVSKNIHHSCSTVPNLDKFTTSKRSVADLCKPIKLNDNISTGNLTVNNGLIFPSLQCKRGGTFNTSNTYVEKLTANYQPKSLPIIAPKALSKVSLLEASTNTEGIPKRGCQTNSAYCSCSLTGIKKETTNGSCQGNLTDNIDVDICSKNNPSFDKNNVKKQNSMTSLSDEKSLQIDSKTHLINNLSSTLLKVDTNNKLERHTILDYNHNTKRPLDDEEYQKSKQLDFLVKTYFENCPYLNKLINNNDILFSSSGSDSVFANKLQMIESISAKMKDDSHLFRLKQSSTENISRENHPLRQFWKDQSQNLAMPAKSNSMPPQNDSSYILNKNLELARISALHNRNIDVDIDEIYQTPEHLEKTEKSYSSSIRDSVSKSTHEYTKHSFSEEIKAALFVAERVLSNSIKSNKAVKENKNHSSLNGKFQGTSEHLHFVNRKQSKRLKFCKGNKRRTVKRQIVHRKKKRTYNKTTSKKGKNNKKIKQTDLAGKKIKKKNRPAVKKATLKRQRKCTYMKKDLQNTFNIRSFTKVKPSRIRHEFGKHDVFEIEPSFFDVQNNKSRNAVTVKKQKQKLLKRQPQGKIRKPKKKTKMLKKKMKNNLKSTKPTKIQSNFFSHKRKLSEKKNHNRLSKRSKNKEMSCISLAQKHIGKKKKVSKSNCKNVKTRHNHKSPTKYKLVSKIKRKQFPPITKKYKKKQPVKNQSRGIKSLSKRKTVKRRKINASVYKRKRQKLLLPYSNESSVCSASNAKCLVNGRSSFANFSRESYPKVDKATHDLYLNDFLTQPKVINDWISTRASCISNELDLLKRFCHKNYDQFLNKNCEENIKEPMKLYTSEGLSNRDSIKTLSHLKLTSKGVQVNMDQEANRHIDLQDIQQEYTCKKSNVDHTKVSNNTIVKKMSSIYSNKSKKALTERNETKFVLKDVAVNNFSQLKISNCKQNNSPVFSFHNPLISNPEKPRHVGHIELHKTDNCKIKKMSNHGKMSIPKMENENKTMNAERRKPTFIGAFSGIGSSCGKLGEDVNQDIANASTLSITSPLKFHEQQQESGYNQELQIKKIRSTMTNGKYNATLGSQMKLGDQDLDGCPEENKQPEVVEKEPVLSMEQTGIYGEASEILRRICYLQKKEDMLFRAALRLQHDRLIMLERHSMLLVNARNIQSGDMSANTGMNLSYTLGDKWNSVQRLERSTSRRGRRRRKKRCNDSRDWQSKVSSDRYSRRSLSLSRQSLVAHRGHSKKSDEKDEDDEENSEDDNDDRSYTSSSDDSNEEESESEPEKKANPKSSTKKGKGKKRKKVAESESGSDNESEEDTKRSGFFRT